MNTTENINEMMVAIEETLGIKIDWKEENGEINLDRANLTIIVEALEVLLTTKNETRWSAKHVLKKSRTGQPLPWEK